MKKSLYLLLGILLICSIYQACVPDVELPGSIYGVVADKATGEPIKSAGVELSPGGLKTITGSEGQFEFTELDPGKYTLLITKTGYLDGVSSTIEVKAGQQAKGDVQIEKLPPALKVVNDNREEISTLDFGSSVDDVARSFSLFNDGTESLEWQITITAEWIKSVSKTEGVLSAGATQSLIVTIDRAKLKSGTNTTTVHITSNNGNKQLTIQATNGTVLATLNTLPATDIKSSSATLNGEILTNGTPKYSERGFVYSLSSMPTIATCEHKLTCALTDSAKFHVTVTGLTKDKTYYVRAYAINAGEEAYSSNEVSFVPSSVIAKVTTNPVSNIARNEGRATFNGTIVDNGDPGYTERGFVYGITHNPMVESDTKIVAAGKGLGEFSVNADSLQVGEVYYVRAYATNEQGTAYGEEVECDFKAIHPAVTTGAVKDIARSAGTATFVGTMVEEGDPVYTEHGFVYGTLHNPTLENDSTVIAAGKGKGEFTSNVTNLQVGVTYYVRAYAKNEYVTVYGEEVTADLSAIMPEVTTDSVYVLDETTAYFIGKITNIGDPEYTERGFIYGTMQTPMIDDEEVTTIVVAKNSSNQFEKQVTISGLDKGTFYVRAYAKSSAEVSYGTILKLEHPDYAAYIALPTFTYDNHVYRVYPDLGSDMYWLTATNECSNLTYGSYSDWFLPSKQELNAMYIRQDEIGGFTRDDYWSRTYSHSEGTYSNSDYAWYEEYYWVQNFGTGKQFTAWGANNYVRGSKDGTAGALNRVRCVRREN